MNILNIKIDELKEYENNPRNNDKAVEAVAESIKQFGFKVPIIIDSNNVIVAGHTRLKAAKKLELMEVPCLIADDLTEEQIKAYRLADNKVSEFSEWDFSKLELELFELSENFDMSNFGFESSEINADEFGEEFSLSNDEKSEICQMTFELHNEQAELIKYAISIVGECSETFGNTNKNGNSIYEVVKQWAELKKLS